MEKTHENSIPSKGNYHFTEIINIVGTNSTNIAIRLSESTAKQLVPMNNHKDQLEKFTIATCLRNLIETLGSKMIQKLSDPNLLLTFSEIIKGDGHNLYFSKKAFCNELHFTSPIGNICLVLAHKS